MGLYLLTLEKQAGAYYTPHSVAHTLVRWAVRQGLDHLLDPSCGDGRFLATHRSCVGVERNPEAVRIATQRAPWATLHQGDFFEWAATTSDRFDCAVGNPPFIRYQTFKGEARARALRLCRSLGASFSGLTSSWAPFLVAAASVLKPSGRMAFVVPAEIGHAPYAVPLIEYLVDHFEEVQIVALKEKVFPSLSEDCWLLFAGGFGGATDHILFSAVERFEPSSKPPPVALRVPVHEWRGAWNCRLRPFVLPDNLRALYTRISADSRSKRLGEIATLGIGYVSGANNFFHLRPSEAEVWGIPEALLYPTVRSSRTLPEMCLTRKTLELWKRSDDPMMLLRIPKIADIPTDVRKYLNSESGMRARRAYKCRMRDPWYSVPDVRVPDYFLTYMSGLAPNLVKNSAAATCTNALHAVHLRTNQFADRILATWRTPFVRLSCELEGHPLGGGMLKLEPREAARVVLPETDMSQSMLKSQIMEAVEVMRDWRHYPIS